MSRRQKVGHLMLEREVCSICFNLGSPFPLEFYYSCTPKLRIRKFCPSVWDEIAEFELLEVAWGNSSRQTASLVDGLRVCLLRTETQA